MLEYLRNAADKPVAKILIGILAFSFVGWGVAEWIFGGAVGDNGLVRVGGEKITVEQFTQARSQEMAKLSKEQQRAIYADADAGATFATNILGELTTEQMVLNRAEDLGFVVTNARVAREIREFPEFQQNGQFSAFLFDTLLMNSGYSEADFARVLRSQALRSMVLGAIAVPVPAPKFATTAAYNARYATRDIDYVAVKYSDFNVGAPTDEQLREYYNQNPNIVPEVRSVSYVLIPAKMDQPDEYEAALTRAQAVEDAIIGGETLAAAANANKAKFVSLGAFSQDKRPVDTILTDAMMAKLFALDEGTESELIETKQGFVIARVDKVVAAHNADFDSVKSGLVGDWTCSEQKKQAYIRANEMLTAMKAGDSVNAKSAIVSRASGAPVDVLNAAFNSSVGAIGITPGTDAFYVVSVKADKMPDMNKDRAAALQKEVDATAARTLTDDYNSFLRREYPVKVNKKVYNRVFAQ